MVTASTLELSMRNRSIKDSDVLRLRRACYERGLVGRDDAEALLRIHHACPVQDPSWAPFLIEAVRDFVVTSEKPEGYLDIVNADWLTAQIGRAGVVSSQTEMELLVQVLEAARWYPLSLGRFAIEQIQLAVSSGTGPLRAASPGRAGHILPREVELVRRVLAAFNSGFGLGITQAEVEVLFDINDALEPAGAIPEWTDLFVKAIANALLSASGYEVPPRALALCHAPWIEDRGQLPNELFLRRMIAASLSSVWAGYRQQTAEHRAVERLERQRITIVTHEQIAQPDAAWLARRLCRDGKITLAEVALLTHFEAAGADVHPILAPLVQSAVRAA